jgi:hypothetical protein
MNGDPVPPSFPRVDVLAVRGGEAWGTINVELLFPGGLDDVGSALPRLVRIPDIRREPVTPGVTRTYWIDQEWALVAVPVDVGTGALGYVYVDAGDPELPPDVLRRILLAHLEE